MGKYSVVITAGAESDLADIVRFIANERGDEAADDWLDELLQAAEALETDPERGSIPPELADLGISDFRQQLLLPYRIIYRIAGRKVYVMVIAHGRRDFAELLQQRLVNPKI